MRFEIDTSDLEKQVHEIFDQIKNRNIDNVKKMIAYIAIKTEARAKFYAPVAKKHGGNLRASIFHYISGDGLWALIGVGAQAPYGIFVEYGTSAHEIRPKYAKALFWEGAEHPVKLVHHPGTGAIPFLRQGFSEALQDALSKWSTGGFG
jgi:hypothetical protein